MKRKLALLLFCIVLTLVGLAGGWFAAHQSASLTAGVDAAGEDAKAEAAAIDERTLANLGVTIRSAERSTFVRYRPVQALVVDRPQNVQPVVAPLGGIVTAVQVRTGGTAAGGSPVITIARDPIPRPKPDLTADVLTPISEEVHDAVAALRSALGRIEIVERNLARVRGAGRNGSSGGVSLMRKSEIEYENEIARIRVELEGAQHELERHGLTAEEIRAVEEGSPAPPNPHLWQHALERHGLWPAAADAIRNALPDDQRKLPWCVAAIGELSAAGLATLELAAALKTDTALAQHFAEAAGLLLEGTPLPTVRLLATEGALEPVVHVRAHGRVERWDVLEVAVRVGQRVESGETMVRLHDAQVMWLRLEPVGAEVGHVVRAFSEGAELEAVPLVEGSGPVLEGFRLERIGTHGHEVEHGGHAYASVENEAICPPGDETACSWSLRVGTRYLVKVPVERLEDRFVLPADAVASRGADRIVFLQDGAGFLPVAVRVEYEDHEVIVVADDGSFFEGDPLVMSGAFPLSLALQVEASPTTEHGHDH